jgi:hypothetical protein
MFFSHRTGGIPLSQSTPIATVSPVSTNLEQKKFPEVNQTFLSVLCYYSEIHHQRRSFGQEICRGNVRSGVIPSKKSANCTKSDAAREFFQEVISDQ